MIGPHETGYEASGREITASETPPAVHEGLTSSEVEERRRHGQVNDVPDRVSRSYADIVRANVFTRFNAMIVILATVVLVFGSPIDALFAFLMVFNTAIGIFQEVRAKRTLDALRVLIAPTIIVVRDGIEQHVEPSSLVLDDLISLRPGDQVPVDASLVESSALEVDESALTGEAEPVTKVGGDEVRSGSVIVAGAARAVAIRVGEDAWIHQLVTQAREFVLTTSEIRSGVNRLLRIIGWMIGPLAALLLWSQLRGADTLEDGMVAAVAGVVSLIPQGLVLLVSMAMAVAIIRLGQNHVVVQELHAVEGLARIDVLCVDKTGTLTTGRFELEEVLDLGPLDASGTSSDVRLGLGALVASEASPTASTRVIAEAIPPPAGWRPTRQVAFSSARKWSATTFEGHGTWVLGAPEVLLDAIGTPPDSATRALVGGFTADAKRVMLVASADGALGDTPDLPAALRPLGLVVLAEQLRPDAAEIMDYFARQHVDVKIISGDSAATVAAVARRLGIDGADRHADLRHASFEAGAESIDDLADRTTVFGRVLPEQKRELVEALRQRGHNVAMTGDGVNDIPALKKADIGIAMDTATSATKSVAQLVLLDGRFDRLPHVVAEGRRVVANMERVSSLFVTKTVYAAIFVLAIGFSGAVFPFLPRHMSLVSELTIGAPAFLLSFRAADEPCRPGYLRRVMRFAIPAGVVASAVTLATYWAMKSPAIDASLAEARTASTVALTSIAFWVLYRLIRPIDRFDAWLLAGFIALFCVLVVVPPSQAFYALEWPSPTGVAVTGMITIGSIFVLETTLRWIRPHRWTWLARLVGDEDPARSTARAI